MTLPSATEPVLLQHAASALALVCWGALAALGRVIPATPAPRWWSAALGLAALAWALHPEGAGWAGGIARVLHETLAFAAILAALEGTLRFRGQDGDAMRWKIGAVALLAVGLLAAPWTGLEPWRSILFDAVCALLLIGLAWVSAREAQPPERLSLRLACAAALLWAVAHAARAALGLPQPVPAWWWLALMLITVTWTTALLLACFCRAHAHVQVLMTQDMLTALPNRGQFEQRLGAFVHQAGAGGAAFSLLMLQVEGVKEVNALLGRDAGDALLAEFARRLRRVLRHADVPARTGGYEFAALLHDLDDPATLQAVTQRLHDRLLGPLQWQGHALEVRCSIGGATWSECQGRTEELGVLANQRLHAMAAAQSADAGGPTAQVSPPPLTPRPPGTRSRASDRGSARRSKAAAPTTSRRWRR